MVPLLWLASFGPSRTSAGDERAVRPVGPVCLVLGSVQGVTMATTKKLAPKQQAKVGTVMSEFKKGSLHSGKDGKIVKNPKQAVVIAMSEARRVGKK